MSARRIWPALLILCALPSATYGAEPLEYYFGKEYVALISVDDVSAFTAGLDKTALLGMERDPEVMPYFRPGLQKPREIAHGTLGMPHDAFLATLSAPAVLGLAPPQPGGQATGLRVAILLRPGPVEAKVKQIFQRLPKGGFLQVQQSKLSDGTACLIIEERTVAAIKGDLVGLSSDKEMLERLLKGPLPPAERLVETDRYKGALKPFTERKADALYAYFDVPAFNGGGAPAAAAETGSDTGDRKAPGARLADRIQAVACAAQPVGKAIRWQTHLYAPGAAKGPLGALGRDARVLLKTAPAEAVGALALRYDFAKVAGLEPGSLAPAKAGALAGLPADVRRDILEALGDDVVGYVLPPEEGLRTWLPRVVVEVGVRDRERLAKALDRLGEHLAEKAKEGSVRYKREASQETVWHLIDLQVPSLSAQFSLAAAVGQKRLMVGALRADVAAALKREGQTPRKNFLDRPEVSQALDRVGGDGALLAYADARPLSDWLRNVAPTLALPLLGIEPETREEGPAERDRRDARDRDRREEGRGERDRRDARDRDRREGTGLEACRENLQVLHEALEDYAARNKDQMPPSLDELVKKRLIEAQRLRCPTSGLRYHYINYGKTIRELTGNVILAYEVTPAHDGRRNILRLGGWETVDEGYFKQALEKIPAHLRAGKPETEAPGAAQPGPPRDDPIPGLGSLPAAEVFSRHLIAHVACVTVDEEGLLQTSEEFAAPAVMVLAAAALGKTPASAETTATVAAPSSETSEQRLKRIGTAIVSHASDHDGKVPANLDQLVTAGLLDAAALICPGTGLKYRYIHHADLPIFELNEGTILAYEPKPNESGQYQVLFVDGRVEMLKEEVLARALGSAFQRPAEERPEPGQPSEKPRPEPRPPTATRPRPKPTEVPLEKQLSSWLTMAQAYLDRNRHERCAFYCKKVLEKAEKGSLYEFRAKRMLERCKEYGVDID